VATTREVEAEPELIDSTRIAGRFDSGRVRVGTALFSSFDVSPV
jgi:hypothetical protein